MTDPKFTSQELAACAAREVAFRKQVYPRLILEEKMSASDAFRETAMMQAIFELLESQHQPRLFS